jgi:Bacterial SH3 domain
MRSSQVFAFLMLLGLIPLASRPAQAAFLKDKEMCVGVIASVDGYANIREQPTTASRIRGTLKKGADVDVYAVVKSGGKYWYRVNRGYVRANQIRRECAGSDGRPDFPYP